MNAGVVRKYLVVHTWTGILSSILLFVAFYAGALSMFEPEISQWVNVTAQSPSGKPDIDALAQAFFEDAAKPPKAAEMTLPTPFDSAVIRFKNAQGNQIAYLDEAGKLAQEPDMGFSTGDFVDYVHRKGGLPLSLEMAEPIIGIVALLYGIALVSGVIVLLPSLVKDLFYVRISRNLKRMWLDLHNVVGITSLPFHVVMAISAAVFCLHDYVYDAQSAAIYPQGIDGVLAEVRAEMPQALPSTQKDWLPPTQLIARAQAHAPSFTPTFMRYRDVADGAATVQLAGTDDAYFARSSRVGYLTLEPATGRILDATYMLGPESTWGSVLASFFSLHFGSYGGVPVRILYALLGVMGAFLFYSGNLLWIASRLKKSGQATAPFSEQPRNVRWLGALTIGACLGCVAGLSAALVAVRWLASSGIAPESIAYGAYYAVFFACLAFAFVRGAWRVSAPLLAFAGLCTLSIPLTSLLALFSSLAPTTGQYLSAMIFIDGFSLVGAMLMFYLAWRTRSRPGRTNSGIFASLFHRSI